MPKLRIQLVTANCSPGALAHLRVDQEFRTIKERVPVGTIDITLAARLRDIINDLRTRKANVVHFSAHGSPLEQIILLDDLTGEEPIEIPRETFRLLFKNVGDISLVFFNACYSHSSATEVSDLVDCAIAVSGKIKDYAALKYSSQFYAALAAGRSVQQAHEEGMIILSPDQLSEDQCPQLIRGKRSPEKVFFIRGSRHREKKKVSRRVLKLKSTSYDELFRRYGVGAECFSVHKVSNADGSSIFSYEIKGLAVCRGELRGLHFSLESAAGLVGDPSLDKTPDNLPIKWHRDRLPATRTMEQVIDQSRNRSGTFQFEVPLRPDSSPYTFGWSVWARNSDALTVWEYTNLYSEKQQVHINGNKLNPPEEFFARLVWFPVQKLIVELELPSTLSSLPFSRFFRLKQASKIPGRAIVKNKILHSIPLGNSILYAKSKSWEDNPEQDRAVNSALQHESPVRFKLVVDSPPLGSCYSLDWRLPDPPIKPEMLRIVRETKAIRESLLKYGERRKAGARDTLSKAVRGLYKSLHEQICAKYRIPGVKEDFQTTFMTYDEAARRLVVVDGYCNDGEMAARSWKFWLPFGFGVAGACFRVGASFCYSRQLDQRLPEIPEHYIPMPDSPVHEFLLTLPIDHPGLNAEMMDDSNSQRSRQLVGVLTISSTYVASKLLEICQQPLPQNKLNELIGLRDQCQIVCDRISKLFLPKSADQP
jgi:hypothetical protein